MANDDKTDLFSQIDVNRDGKIDTNELRDWATGGEERISTTYETTTGRFSHFNSANNRYDQNTTYRGTTGIDNYDSATAIHTSGPEETNRYLASAGRDVYKDSYPRTVRRPATGSPMVQEQNISVRYLRPPTPPAPGPLIIKEVRPSQPPPPQPLVIQERAPKAATPPPLILRERPPTPPPSLPSETRTRVLSPIPVPPRSLFIERFPAPPPKPRDIIIERWLPYGPAPERRTVVEPAPPPIKYPEPTHTIILHENVETRIVRKFKDLGVSRGDPNSYKVTHGSSLLDSAVLVREARAAGVIEDITPPSGSTTVTTTHHKEEYTSGCDNSTGFVNQGYSSCTSDCDSSQLNKRFYGNYNLNNTRQLSSSSYRLNDTGSNCYSTNISARFNVNNAGLSAAIRLGDGETKELEYRRYI